MQFSQRQLQLCQIQLSLAPIARGGVGRSSKVLTELLCVMYVHVRAWTSRPRWPVSELAILHVRLKIINPNNTSTYI